MKEILIIIAFVGIWYLLQVYILPKLGISTGMRDSCQVTGKKDKGTQTEKRNEEGGRLGPNCRHQFGIGGTELV